MSTLGEAMRAVKETLLLADKVERVSATLVSLAGEVSQHEKRIIRLETYLDLAMRFRAAGPAGKLPGPGL